jgi:hypothetical protein
VQSSRCRRQTERTISRTEGAIVLILYVVFIGLMIKHG